MNTNDTTTTDAQAVNKLLGSWSVGQGKTSQVIEDNYYFIDSDTINIGSFGRVTIPLVVQQGLALNTLYKDLSVKSDKQVQASLSALQAGYLSVNHANQSNKQAGPLGNPLKVAGKVKTASEYLRDSIKINLDKISSDTIIELDTKCRAVNDKTSKADLFKLLDAYRELFITQSNSESYQSILDNEIKAAKYLEALEQAGLVNITLLNDGTYSASIQAVDAQAGLNTLKTNSYTLITHSFSLDTGLITLIFKKGEDVVVL